MKFLLQNDKLSRNSPSERGVSLVHRLARVATQAREIFDFENHVARCPLKRQNMRTPKKTVLRADFLHSSRCAL